MTPLQHWGSGSFDQYLQKTREQIGGMWAISDDATIATCGNLELAWSEKYLTWSFRANGIEVDRFQLPLAEASIYRFRRQCSNNYINTK